MKTLEETKQNFENEQEAYNKKIAQLDLKIKTEEGKLYDAIAQLQKQKKATEYDCQINCQSLRNLKKRIQIELGVLKDAYCADLRRLLIDNDEKGEQL